MKEANGSIQDSVEAKFAKFAKYIGDKRTSTIGIEVSVFCQASKAQSIVIGLDLKAAQTLHTQLGLLLLKHCTNS